MNASAKPTAPRGLASLSPADRLTVMLLRRRAAGQGPRVLARVAEQVVPPGGEDVVVDGVFSLVDALADVGGPDIHLRPIPCKGLAEDEVTILRLLGTAQVGDAASARVFAETLVRPEALDRLLTAADVMASALTRVGQPLSLTTPAPEMAWSLA